MVAAARRAVGPDSGIGAEEEDEEEIVEEEEAAGLAIGRSGETRKVECFKFEEEEREAEKTTTTTTKTKVRNPRAGCDSYCDVDLLRSPSSLDITSSSSPPTSVFNHISTTASYSASTTTTKTATTTTSESSSAAAAVHFVVDPCCSPTCRGGYMFRSRRGNLVRRLWKTRLRTATTGGPSTPTGGAAAGEGAVGAGGCYEYCGISRPVETGDRSEDEFVVEQVHNEDGSQECTSPVLSKSHAFAFLEQLDVTQLEALLCAVQTGAEEVTPCVMVGVSVPLPGALDGIPPAVICGQLWRWPNAKLTKLSLRRLPFCEAPLTDCSGARRTMDTQSCRGKAGDSSGALTCCNPYHWSILTLPGNTFFIECCATKSLQLKTTNEHCNTRFLHFFF